MQKKLGLATTILMLGLAAAHADTNADAVRRSLTEEGFNNIEITREDGMMTVEALRGQQKIEITYDMATGTIVKHENMRVRGSEAGDDQGNDDQNDDHGGSGDDDSDDGAGHDSGDDHGGDDGHSGDHDDDAGDDHGGSHDGGGDDSGGDDSDGDDS